MKWTRANTRTAWTTKHSRQSRAPAITTLCRVVRQQIEAGGNEIDKLKLSHRAHAHQRRATCRSDNRAFGDRRVNNSFFAELVKQTIGDLERAAIRADVFSDHEHRRVPFHLFPDPLPNRFDEGSLPATFGARRFVFFLYGS